PLGPPLHAPRPLRPDVVNESNHRAAFQAIGPAVESGLYLVPKVIE
ncbi:MAG: aspartyl/glutamyl-tRNA amidotransferase subunit C, partial [Pseudomonas sp.]|nr:aspartyl/glutamyl-tRNA amidotransferase subunit C [Pseudomonas sp.]